MTIRLRSAGFFFENLSRDPPGHPEWPGEVLGRLRTPPSTSRKVEDLRKSRNRDILGRQNPDPDPKEIMNN